MNGSKFHFGTMTPRGLTWRTQRSTEAKLKKAHPIGLFEELTTEDAEDHGERTGK